MARVKSGATAKTDTAEPKVRKTRTRSATPAGIDAKNVPAIIRPAVESGDIEPAKLHAREFNENTNELLGGGQKIEPADTHQLGSTLENLGFDANGKRIRGKKWHDDMAFANEFVTVMVHKTTDKNAHPLPDVYVNGRVQRFPRGEEIKVRRCYVERLVFACATTYGNVKIQDANGDDKYVYPAQSAEVFPFTVINDTPKGVAWLKGLLSQRQ